MPLCDMTSIPCVAWPLRISISGEMNASLRHAIDTVRGVAAHDFNLRRDECLFATLQEWLRYVLFIQISISGEMNASLRRATGYADCGTSPDFNLRRDECLFATYSNPTGRRRRIYISISGEMNAS